MDIPVLPTCNFPFWSSPGLITPFQYWGVTAFLSWYRYCCLRGVLAVSLLYLPDLWIKLAQVYLISKRISSLSGSPLGLGKMNFYTWCAVGSRNEVRFGLPTAMVGPAYCQDHFISLWGIKTKGKFLRGSHADPLGMGLADWVSVTCDWLCILYMYTGLSSASESISPVFEYLPYHPISTQLETYNIALTSIIDHVFLSNEIDRR